jgi:hypothetical protein
VKSGKRKEENDEGKGRRGVERGKGFKSDFCLRKSARSAGNKKIVF